MTVCSHRVVLIEHRVYEDFASLETGQVFNGVEIKVGKREVHNLLKYKYEKRLPDSN